MKKLLIFAFSIMLLLAVIVPVTACAETAVVNITSKEAILMSTDGQVLYEHNATEKRPIASMTKIMTLLCAYDAIDSGKVSLDDSIVASQRAASMGGSQVYLDANAAYKMVNLIKSIIVCSANDSCVAVAEHVSGSVENFVENMNGKAKELGLTNTHFENCTGLPAVSQYSCAKDVGVMLSQLIKHPHYFTCANIWMEDFTHPSGRVTEMTNTNKLVRFYDGCDGGKTGYTSEAKHCLAATARRGDTRVIAVVVGANDSQTRFKEVSEMFNYAFANYESKVYVDGNTKLENVAVQGGKQDTLELAAEGKLTAFGKKGSVDYNVQVELPEKVKAPVSQGDVVGIAKLVDANGAVVGQINIVAKTNVESKSYWDYVKDLVREG
ncbi:MAG: D-alanyl-D-alanine carboxypeptidase [Clostridiales bacterium]|nr:D-alanyl-D-alanine carboxypeptidase [Clostridiales bacterium]